MFHSERSFHLVSPLYHRPAQGKLREISEPLPILPGLAHCLKTTLKFAARSLSYSLDSIAIKVH